MKEGQDVTSLVERLEAFEDRFEVRLEAVSALVENTWDDSYSIGVRGELHPADGTELTRDVNVEAVAYDRDGRVVQTGSYYIDSESLFGFVAFEISLSIPKAMQLSKIRLYPKGG